MIWELVQYAITPVHLPYVRPMGFLKEAIATAARSKRCRTAWAPHYAKCRDLLLAEAHACANKRKALIFGAGTLNDIPLAELATLFDEVWLVDLVFLPAARKRARGFANVRLIEHDVTESMSAFYQGELLVAMPQRWLNDKDIDWVVSLNLLTQLPTMPLAWLRKRRTQDENVLENIAKGLLQAHIAYLQAFQAPVVLIADREAQRFDREGTCLETFELWWGLPVLAAEESWHWSLAPLGEMARDFAQTHRVGVNRWQRSISS
ncbi:hypothetical protein [Thiomicrorhabdus cannonii]|uniref:hypothetical protein n=1 Tax=Thiomicrorhabdus cannonii TaxID=2748011 RepID=UPI0015B80352|nr:hypothetical protein [Thiomicrorhabdus cannonii]